MKKVTLIVCMLLIISMVLPLTTYASEDRASEYFAADSCYLHITSGTKFQVWFDVIAVGGMDEIGVRKITVQRSVDGSDWESVAPFTKEDYPQMVATNTFQHSGYVSYTGTRGYYYRAYVEFHAKKGTGSAMMPRYTSPIDLT